MRYWSIRFRGSPWALPVSLGSAGELPLLSDVCFYPFFPSRHLSGNSHSIGCEFSVLIKIILTRNLPMVVKETRGSDWQWWLRNPTVDLWSHVMKSAGNTWCQRLIGEPSFILSSETPSPSLQFTSVSLGCHSDQFSKMSFPHLLQYWSQPPNLHVCGWMGQHHTSPFWGAMWDCPSVLSNDLSFRRTHSSMGQGSSAPLETAKSKHFVRCSREVSLG